MALTVDAAFNEFYDKINLAGNHRGTANARRDSVVSLLRKDFTVLDAFSTGSIPKFTALRNEADLDVMVVLHYGLHVQGKTPSALLQNVQKCLSGYTTRARSNGQAVTMYFKTWPNVDIVPVARSVDGNGNISHYIVPNTNTGGWIESEPRAHAALIEQASTTCGKNFRRIIKMVKHWSRAHGDFLTGYHIEVLALRLFNFDLSDLPWQIYWFFDQAERLLSNSLWHQRSFADDYLNIWDRAKVREGARVARDASLNAWHATYGWNKDHQAAITDWRKVFGDEYPAFG